jgi:hypothetical protein
VNQECQRAVNLYLEIDELGEGLSAQTLNPTPGLSVFANAPNDTPVRGFQKINNRCFAVIGAVFYEVLANGTLTNRGPVINDGKLASMSASPLQILIASGGTAYVFTLATNAFVALSSALFAGPVFQVGFIDGFFIALIQNSNQFQVSAPENATSWDLANIATISVFSDNVLGMLCDHRQLWLWGPHESVVYYDSGGELFPFDVVPGSFIEQGIAAGDSAVQLDNSVMWLGSSDRGDVIAWRANGYTPQRISNYGVETAWATYATVADAIGFSYTDQGHPFYVLYFPTANKTWVYDVSTNSWHERTRWNQVTALSEAFHAQCHILFNGLHLVGDYSSGNIYQMSTNIVTDNGGPIQRIRSAPHISSEQEWIFHHQLQIDVETGLGPQPPLLDGFGLPRAPQMMLRWSDDGGHTWSNLLTRSCGQAGKFKTRVIFRRLGKSRDRVYEISMTDPISWRIIDGYLRADPGFAEPTERISKQYQKVT